MMAASSQNSNITSRLLEAGAYPDTQDSGGRTPLQYATMANNIKGMDHLLKYNSEVDDESLHIAARQLDLPAVKVLLANHARTDLPGVVHCGGRTPLGETCRMADLSENPHQLKKTLTLLCKATKNLSVLTNGRSLLLQALENNTPLKMATALLTCCMAVKDGINDDFNIFVKGSLHYSPTAYVRHFKCTQAPSSRSIDLSHRCCSLETCPATKLESLLHAHGCLDRFWDAAAGANQPKGLRNPPRAIVESINDAEAARKEQARQVRAEAEESARKAQIQRDLDDAAAADRKRELDRLKVFEEVKASEIRTAKEKAAAEARAIEQRTKEEEKGIRRLAAVKAEEAEEKRRRKLKEYNEKKERERTRDLEREERETQKDRRVERTLRERSNIQIDRKKKEANIQKEILKEQRNLLGEHRRLADKMLKYDDSSGVRQVNMGRVLGEIE